MNVKLELSADEVRDLIPYQIICETMDGSKWNTIRRKVMQKEWFTMAEMKHFSEIKRTAERWYLRTGIPKDGITITSKQLILWQRLGLFCSAI